MSVRVHSAAAALGLAVVLVGSGAWAAEAPHWKVSPASQPDMCMAVGATDGDARLILVATDTGGVAFQETAPDMPTVDGELPVTLAFAGYKPLEDRALSTKTGVVFFLGSGDAVRPMLAASTVRLEVSGQAHTFALAGAVESLDDLARCARASAPKP